MHIDKVYALLLIPNLFFLGARDNRWWWVNLLAVIVLWPAVFGMWS